MNKNARRKVGKLIIGVLAIILVSLISIVSTIAYLSDKAGEETHQFTLGKGVDIELIQDTAEPEEFYPEKEYPEKAASVKIPLDTAMEYEYVGVKVQFFTEKTAYINNENALKFVGTSYSVFSGDYGKIISYSEEASNLNVTSGTMNKETRIGWKEYEDSVDGKTSESSDGTIYLYYGVKTDSNTGNNITGDELTKVLHGSELMIFDSIRINKTCSQTYPPNTVGSGDPIKLYHQDNNSAENAITRYIYKDQLKGFRIVVTAYAIQGDIEPDVAETSLVELIKNN